MRLLNCSDCAVKQLELKHFELLPSSAISFISVTPFVSQIYVVTSIQHNQLKADFIIPELPVSFINPLFTSFSAQNINDAQSIFRAGKREK
jgi:hypothetical protein